MISITSIGPASSGAASRRASYICERAPYMLTPYTIVYGYALTSGRVL